MAICSSFFYDSMWKFIINENVPDSEERQVGHRISFTPKLTSPNTVGEEV